MALRAAVAQEPCPAGAGAALPDLTLPCLSGGPDVRLRAPGPGRPMLVNVWATWCGPCVREVPEFVGLARDGAGKIDVLGVLTEDIEGNGLEFARQFRLGVPFVATALAYRRALGVFAVVKRHYAFVTRAGGVMLVLAGLALLTGALTEHIAAPRGWVGGYHTVL